MCQEHGLQFAIRLERVLDRIAKRKDHSQFMGLLGIEPHQFIGVAEILQLNCLKEAFLKVLISCVDCQFVRVEDGLEEA